MGNLGWTEIILLAIFLGGIALVVIIVVNIANRKR